MNQRLNRKAFVATMGAAGLGLGMAAAGGTPTAAAHARETHGAAHGEGIFERELQAREQFYAEFTAALANELFGASRSGTSSAQPGIAPSQNGVSPGRGEMTPDRGDRGAERGGRERRHGEMHPGAPTPTGPRPATSATEAAATPAAPQSGAGGVEGAPAPAQPDRAASASEPGGVPSGADLVDAAIRKAMMNVVDIRASEGVLSYGQAEAVKELVATTAAPIEPGLFGERLFGSVVSVAGRGRHVGMGGGARAMEPERGRMPASYEGDLPEMDEGGSDVRVDRASERRRDRTDRAAAQP